MSNKIKSKNHTQKNTSEEYNKQYLLWLQSNASFDEYMWTVGMELKMNDAPDIDEICKDYKTLTQLLCFFHFGIKNSDLSEEKQDYYIKGLFDKYIHCVSIITNLCELKGAKIEIAMEEGYPLTNALLSFFIKNKIMVMEDDKTLKMVVKK
jgi:hypothetical protein